MYISCIPLFVAKQLTLFFSCTFTIKSYWQQIYSLPMWQWWSVVSFPASFPASHLWLQGWEALGMSLCQHTWLTMNIGNWEWGQQQSWLSRCVDSWSMAVTWEWVLCIFTQQKKQWQWLWWPGNEANIDSGDTGMRPTLTAVTREWGQYWNGDPGMRYIVTSMCYHGS